MLELVCGQSAHVSELEVTGSTTGLVVDGQSAQVGSAEAEELVTGYTGLLEGEDSQSAHV